MFEAKPSLVTPAVWQIGALCRAIAEALDARFNPVVVRGELSSFSRAASGHCYFSLKDESGQIRCAMFRRAASSLDFSPREGELVEVRGRLGVYEARGDLQLIVESMSRAGQGALFEQFLQLKAKLEAQGLFAPERKRALPLLPRAIGVVTSLGAAALHDVVTALKRRVPHIPVLIVPATVQGGSAPGELIQALSNLYLLTQQGRGLEPDFVKKITKRGGSTVPCIDVILLVRGGGSMEDLWAFNDEQLAQTLARSPVPVICGVGHETDFTIADFVADLRAPTPTAAAELVAQPQQLWLGALDATAQRLQRSVSRRLDQQNQRLDLTASRFGRPSALVGRARLRLSNSAQRLQLASTHFVQQKAQGLQRLALVFPTAAQRGLQRQDERLQRAALRLGLLDPHLVLERGYAWLSTPAGAGISSVQQTRPGQALRATLADGTVDLTVTA
ncbi:MAG: exodeoxyribonuclease VII large subunit [Gammaproteobacteria bacterium]|uniref:exodeoxyribonuclease VII large subunit n=1 Tax=Rhodoferax sp. TaxID=50421 RepID=UPI0017E1FE52|nr:exodeoxyribonuclease VII large subunit [Rhodoferax sp.]MBU3898889.1 exodeoxyribonuclease VII large subunit [Gammaproteobacteria bacterium]MBA3059510.1 exodeoxyribonuclease VII large subunit [Rhodoferax sp.]MBU3999080.1 exodeoxyribonuclease VII large subunit [Gammaproteobacteria bacterium]MBU4019365.1 exodeoxyribonuclease VII large subunit [Gammaproteobacteria bacterium]MBU4081929.1 exodeoxyribonuclease VII large subunit [Gammaproteobacteria bacterium]